MLRPAAYGCGLRRSPHPEFFSTMLKEKNSGTSQIFWTCYFLGTRPGGAPRLIPGLYYIRCPFGRHYWPYPTDPGSLACGQVAGGLRRVYPNHRTTARWPAARSPWASTSLPRSLPTFLPFSGKCYRKTVSFILTCSGNYDIATVAIIATKRYVCVALSLSSRSNSLKLPW